MSDHIPYGSFEEARMQDATLNQMLMRSCPLTTIILQLVNEKAALLREVAILKMSAHPPRMVLHPDGRITPSTNPIHIPHIPPNTPQ